MLHILEGLTCSHLVPYHKVELEAWPWGHLEQLENQVASLALLAGSHIAFEQVGHT